MKNLFLTTTAAGAALAMSMPAQAGNYVTLFGGVSFLGDSNDHVMSLTGTTSFSTTSTTGKTLVTSAPQTFTSYAGIQYVYQFNQITMMTSSSYAYVADLDVSTDTGFVVGAAMGKDVPGGWSWEIEAAYRKHNLDADMMLAVSGASASTTTSVLMQSSFTHVTNVTVSATASVTTSSVFGTSLTAVGSPVVTSTTGTNAYSTTLTQSGDFSAFSIMGNVWYDLTPASGGTMHPYIGGGIGWAKVDFSAGSISADDSGLAYQLGAGVGWDMGGGRLNLEYRYFAVADVSFDLGGGATFDGDYNASEILVGWKMPL